MSWCIFWFPNQLWRAYLEGNQSSWGQDWITGPHWWCTGRVSLQSPSSSFLVATPATRGEFMQSRVIAMVFTVMRKETMVFWDIRLSYPAQRSWGGYTGFTLFVRPSVRPSAVSVRMITWILFIGFQFFRYMHHLGEDLRWYWIWASYLIKYAHNGRSCDLSIFGIPEVNFPARAFKLDI